MSERDVKRLKQKRLVRLGGKQQLIQPRSARTLLHLGEMALVIERIEDHTAEVRSGWRGDQPGEIWQRRQRNNQCGSQPHAAIRECCHRRDIRVWRVRSGVREVPTGISVHRTVTRIATDPYQGKEGPFYRLVYTKRRAVYYR